MRTVKIAGLVLAGLLIVSSTAFAHGGGGGGGHGGGGFGGGGHFGSAGHVAAGRFGGGHYGYNGHYYRHNGGWYGGPYYSGYPFGIGIDDFGYYNDPYAYTDDQGTLDNSASLDGTVVAAQKELAKLGYYHGSIDGVIGPETVKAIRWFQSVDKISVTGELNDQTLKALQIT